MPSLRPLPLACTVRGCGLPIERRARAFACPRGHSYDIARTGYVNLLQPQDRKSRAAGDAPGAVRARAALFAAGVGSALIDDVVRRLRAVRPGADAVVVDLGSGTGDALAAVAAARPITGVGIDLSVAAAAHAARRCPDVTWVVANADRRLPLLDRSVTVVLSLNARRNPRECARVLEPDGRLLMAVPAPDDLIELREVAQGTGIERDRVPALVAEHAPWFALLDQATVRDRRTLDEMQLHALLGSTYRARRADLTRLRPGRAPLEVTLSSVLCLFAPRSGAGPAAGETPPS